MPALKLRKINGRLAIPDVVSLNGAAVEEGVVFRLVNIPRYASGIVHQDYRPQHSVVIPIHDLDPKPEVGWTYDSDTKTFAAPVKDPAHGDLLKYAAEVRHKREVGGVKYDKYMIPTNRGLDRDNLRHQRDLAERGERADPSIYKFGAFTYPLTNQQVITACQMQSSHIQRCFDIEHHVIEQIMAVPPLITKHEQIDAAFANA